MKKSRIILTLLPLLLIPSLVGIGFALYDFDDTNSTSNTGSVDINVNNASEIGTLNLVFKNLVGGYSFDSSSNTSYTSVTYSSEYVDEIGNSELTNPIITKLYFGFAEVDFRRSDNPSTERNFVLKFDKNPKFDYETEYKIGVDCLLTISDTDEKGVTLKDVTTSNEKIPASNSIIDIFQPTNISFKSDESKLNDFEVKQDEDNSITYKANIIDDLSTLTYEDNTTYTDAFYLNLDYKTHKITSEGTTETYTFLPNAYSHSYTNLNDDNGMPASSRVLNYINEAIDNSSISISFVLNVSQRS